MRPLCTLAFAVLALGCAAATSRTATARSGADAAARAGARTDTLTAEAVVALRSVTTVEISPDGKRVAYVVRSPRASDDKPGNARNVIWVVSSRGGEPRRFTSPRASSSSPRWSPDGRWLAFLSQREGETERTQIWRIAVDGGEPERLTESATSVRDLEWLPGGQGLVYSADRVDTDAEKAAKKAGRDWKIGDVDGTHRRLWTFDVASRESREVTDAPLHVERFRVSPDGRRIAFVGGERADTDAVMMYSRLYVVETKGGTPSPVCKTAGKLGELAWSPDGSTLAFLGASDIHDPTAGVLFTVPSRGGDATARTAAYEGTGQSVDWLDDRTIAMLANERTSTVVVAVPAKQGPMRRLVGPGPICHRIDIAGDRRTLACAGDVATHPGEVFVGELRGGRLRRVTHGNPQLDRMRLGEQEVVRWKAADGLEIEGILTKPVDYRAGQRYPLAVLVHGGPEGISLDGWNTRAGYPVQLLAAKGFVVLEPNYRGSSGRGVAFGKADHGDLGGKEFEDVLAGIDHLAAKGLVDPARVGMGGWSYGGYFSGLAATLHTGRFKAAVVAAAITNWMSFTGTTEIEHENSLVHWKLWPYDEHERTWLRSPMAHTKKSKTATLIVHGLDDTRVPPGQAKELYRALRHAGTATELVLYPREGHGVAERAHQIDFATRLVEWFDRHVK
jgi:dipeptidyl aminopeptidase/acylaminoacyl peptidase